MVTRMDERRFDELARRIAVDGRSRRSAIKALLGAVVGGALTLAGHREGDAATCRSAGSTCREHANCCSKTCLPASQFRDHRARCACQGGAPPCGSSCCTGVNPACCPANECADLDSDPQHCGSCGNVAETDRNEACCGGVITQLGTNTNCASCGDNCTVLGSEFHCAVGPGGLFCTDIPCPPQPPTVSPTAPGTATGLCTITNTETPTTFT
jgi:hypothetical protein